MENIEKQNASLDNDLKKTIGNNLTELRKRNKLTQAELAEKLNYSDKAISKWERGEAVPDIQTLVEISKLYGVKLDYLVSNESQEVKDILYSTDDQRKPNKIVICLMSAMLPWMIACLIFFYINTISHKNWWMAFIYAIPCSAIILLIFNSIWGKKFFKYILVSFIIWSLLLAFYLQELVSTSHNVWLIFILGIPCQITVALWSQLHKPKKIRK